VVHVQLEDLVLAELAFNLQGQQNLVDLAGEGLLCGQVEVAGHLHGDGGRTLATGVAHVGQTGPQDADVVHAMVFIEARIFDGQDGVAHHGRDLVDAHIVALFLAKLADQRAISGVHPQGHHRAVGAEAVQFR